jgi:alpha-tubulin suppressor-like RCC1 family protein
VLALDNNGCVWSWGLNDRGQLGYGNNSPSPTKTPQKVKNSATPGDFLCGVSSIAAGDATGYAIKTDGTVVAWGKNTNGQVGMGGLGGNGSCACQWYPQKVVCGSVGGANCVGGFLSGVIQISGGQSHVIALLNTGEVVGWGAGAEYALGNGVWANQNSPTYVQTSAGINLTGIDVISDGDLNGWAYDKETNFMYVWGG